MLTLPENLARLGWHLSPSRGVEIAHRRRDAVLAVSATGRRESELAGVTCMRYKTSEDSLGNQPDFSLMRAAYFTTCFVIEEPCSDWPVEFAIITAYATTGEDWTLGRNTTADEALALRLHESKLWHRRITGYSPTTGHAEPGWTADLSVEAACKLGQEFHQDAIYFVRDDSLFVTHCKPPCTLEPVGNFRERVSLRGMR